MTWTPAQIAASAALEDAINGMLAAFDSYEPHQVVTSYTVIVGATSFLKDNTDVYEPDDDDEAMVSSYTAFYRRGQQPVVTRGLVESFIDRYRREGNF